MLATSFEMTGASEWEARTGRSSQRGLQLCPTQWHTIPWKTPWLWGTSCPNQAKQCIIYIWDRSKLDLFWVQNWFWALWQNIFCLQQWWLKWPNSDFIIIRHNPTSSDPLRMTFGFFGVLKSFDCSLNCLLWSVIGYQRRGKCVQSDHNTGKKKTQIRIRP